MIFGDPPPSQYDLHFRVFGVPVRVHPWFWIVGLLLGVSGREQADPFETVVWMGVFFFSILAHELGHAFLQRRYGGHPRIALYGLGGLAMCDDCDRSARSQILISLAGPVAGFIVAAIVFVLVRASGRQIGFLPPTDDIDWARLGLESVVVQPMIVLRAYFEPFASPVANSAVADLLQINILWGLINLLPIYPLDGGRISREVLTLRHPSQGIVQSLWMSAVAAAAMALFGLLRGSLFTAILFGYLAYSSYQTLQRYQQYRL